MNLINLIDLITSLQNHVNHVDPDPYPDQVLNKFDKRLLFDYLCRLNFQPGMISNLVP